MAQAFKRFVPLFDRILVQKTAQEIKTKGGIMIPESAKGRILDGTVVAAGAGMRTEAGSVVPMAVKVGDKVMLPEFGGTKINLDDNDYFLYRDGDLLGKFES